MHRLVTLSIKHGEETRDQIELMDYSNYADMCSEKSLNAKRSSTQCTRVSITIKSMEIIIVVSLSAVEESRIASIRDTAL